VAIGHDLAFRIGVAARESCRCVVNDVAAINGILNPINHFRRRGARLGELACDATHFHHGLAASKCHHHGHLQEHAEEVADVISRMFGKAFSAIATLQQEAPAFSHTGQLLLQLAGLACKNQRRKSGQVLFGARQSIGVGIGGHLLYGKRTPCLGRPLFFHLIKSKLHTGSALIVQCNVIGESRKLARIFQCNLNQPHVEEW
jgi:hypothetical protein